MNACVVCNVPSDKKCGLCSSVFYCSKEHQKKDWKYHKVKCVPYKIETSPELGRYLVAAGRLTPGQEVLHESALVSGPSQVTVPVCLGCYRVLTLENALECPKCGWPMCSLECAKKSQHKPECFITTQYRGSKVKIQTFEVAHPSYECLTVLRCLHLKENKPSQWKKLLELESHCEERMKTEKYERDRNNIAKFIHRFFKYTEFTEEEILRIVGIININGHEVPTSGHDFVSVYETASYLEHNCQSNCSKSFTSTGDLVIRAATTIKPGDHLSICYTDPLWGTENRRQHLLDTKFFSCNCQRCADPTEFESHFDSLLCNSGGCKGYITAKNPLDGKTAWNCKKCQKQLNNESAQAVLEKANTIAMTTDKNNLVALLTSIKKLEEILHPNHYLITEAKLAVTQLLDEGVERLTDDILTIKLRFCQQLYKLTKHLVPAENRCLGVLLFGLHAALAESGRRRSNRGEIDQSDLVANLLECKEFLTESYRYLRYEPEILPEGEIAIQAKVNLNDIEKILQTLHLSMGNTPI